MCNYWPCKYFWFCIVMLWLLWTICCFHNIIFVKSFLSSFNNVGGAEYHQLYTHLMVNTLRFLPLGTRITSRMSQCHWSKTWKTMRSKSDVEAHIIAAPKFYTWCDICGICDLTILWSHQFDQGAKSAWVAPDMLFGLCYSQIYLWCEYIVVGDDIHGDCKSKYISVCPWEMG